MGVADLPLETLARFPFLSDTKEWLASDGIGLEDIFSDPGHAGVWNRATARVLQALQGGIEPGPMTGVREELDELLSYPAASILVSLIDDDYLTRRYVLGEAELFSSRLAVSPATLRSHIATDLGLKVLEGRRIAMVDYIRATRRLKASEWKLVHQDLDHGEVHLDARRLARVLQNVFHDRLEEKLPGPVAAEWSETLADHLDIIRLALEVRKARIKPVELGAADQEAFPPCMRHILSDLQEGTNVAHSGRFSIVTFLREVGMDYDGIIGLFSQAPDFSEERSRYQIMHIIGDSTGRPYSVPVCKTLQTLHLCQGADNLCAKDWLKHPMQYYRARMRRRRKESAGKAPVDDGDKRDDDQADFDAGGQVPENAAPAEVVDRGTGDQAGDPGSVPGPD